MRRTILLTLLVVSGALTAQEGADESASEPRETEPGVSGERAPDAAGEAQAAEQSGGIKALSGMSILGNEEAPKSLVIVPWKSSQIGDGIGAAHALDDAARPVDKEVFMREVHYYELRSSAQD